jgi:hypothetical protein
MATRNFNANKSSLFAKTGSSELGGGQDKHLPVGGSWNGYTFRSAVRFATDWSGMKTIQSAVLWMKTSSAVHLAFSSDPDIYVARATSDWTANNSSSSADGGGGWSTAATNYPGPSLTTTGQVNKDVSTAEQTWISVDISTIVRAWAPTSVEGGGGAANYGVVLYGVASGDLTEFNSAESTVPPYIVVTYATDTAPVATMTGPTGVQGTRPTLAGTAVDAEGDPITNVHVEVSQGATVVYQADLGAVASPWSHVPTADLPGGALTVRAVAGAGGLTGAYSAALAFTVDRPPVVGAFTSPPASGSNRRPPITFGTSDPDGNATTAWDLQVYATSGGVAAGSPVYQALAQTSGISAGQVTHTPTADLPGGALVVRARVQSGPGALWSAWSADYPFVVALTTPSVTYLVPASVGGYVTPDGTFSDLATAFSKITHAHTADLRPPAGQTLTRMRIWVGYTAADPSVAGQGTLVWDAAPTPAGQQAGWGSELGASGSVVFATAFEATASGGGVTKAWRWGKCSLVEWIGRVRLGDQVTALTATPDQMGAGLLAGWIRAENLAGAGLAAWRATPPTPAAILPELPAAEAWLGLRNRYAWNAPDVDLLAGTGSFEDPALTGWATSGQVSSQAGIANSPPTHGGRILRITGDGVTPYPQASRWVQVFPGATYTLSGSLMTAGVAGEMDVRCDAHSTPGVEVQSFLMRLMTSGGGQVVWSTQTSTAKIPAGCYWLLVLIYIAAAPAAAGVDGRWDNIQVVGPKPLGGLDRWDLAWTSLG